MFKVGITGGIGSGKTLVCSVLESLGVPIYSADSKARRLMNENPVLKSSIEALLGREAYIEGELDRRFVARKVFGNPILLDKLNQLVHPAVRDDFHSWSLTWPEASYVVEEAAILFESGASSHLDMSVLVYAPIHIRILRVMQRDGVDREDVERRMEHQMDEEEKRVLADEVICNDEKSMLLPQIIALHNTILKTRVN